MSDSWGNTRVWWRMNFSRKLRKVAASGRHPRQLTMVVKYDNIEIAMAEARKTRSVSWIKGALKDFQESPEGAKSILLGALTIAADGGKADIAKPFRGFGSGVLEIALAYRSDAFRVVYAVQLGLRPSEKIL